MSIEKLNVLEEKEPKDKYEYKDIKNFGDIDQGAINKALNIEALKAAKANTRQAEAEAAKAETEAKKAATENTSERALPSPTETVPKTTPELTSSASGNSENAESQDGDANWYDNIFESQWVKSALGFLASPIQSFTRWIPGVPEINTLAFAKEAFAQFVLPEWAGGVKEGDFSKVLAAAVVKLQNPNVIVAKQDPLSQLPVRLDNGELPSSENDVAQNDVKNVPIVTGGKQKKVVTLDNRDVVGELKRVSGYAASNDITEIQVNMEEAKNIILSNKNKNLLTALQKYSPGQLKYILLRLSGPMVWKIRDRIDLDRHAFKNQKGSRRYRTTRFKSLLAPLLGITLTASDIYKLVYNEMTKQGYSTQNRLFKHSKNQTFREDVLWIMALLYQESKLKPFNLSHTGAIGLAQMTSGNYKKQDTLGGAFNPFNYEEGIRNCIIHLKENTRTVKNKTFKNIITAYNSGAGAMNRGKLSNEAKEYYAKIKTHLDEGRIPSSIA